MNIHVKEIREAYSWLDSAILLGLDTEAGAGHAKVAHEKLKGEVDRIDKYNWDRKWERFGL